MADLSPYSIREIRPHEAIATQRSGSLAVGEQLDFREYWRVIRRHLALIIAITVGALVLAVITLFTITPTFTATATIEIDPQAPEVLDMKQLLVEQSGSEVYDYYKTQYALLEGRTLAARVIHSLNLQANPLFGIQQKTEGLLASTWSHAGEQNVGPNSIGDWYGQNIAEDFGLNPQSVDRYLAHLTVQPQFGTRLVKISFGSPDPKLSAVVANAHAEAYVNQGMELRVKSSEAAQHFLEGKLVDLRERVEKAEAALNSYRHDKGIVEFSTSEKNEILLSRLEDLSKAFTEAQTRRIALQAEVAEIRQENFDSLPEVVDSATVQALKPQLAGLEAQYASMSSRYTTEYAPLVALRAKLNDMRSLLKRTVYQTVNSIKISYESATDREARLRAEVESEKQHALALHDAAVKDAILARDVDTSRELYESVLKRMKEIGVAAQIQSSNVMMVDHAVAPTRPSSPRKLLTLLLTGILSLSGGIGLAFFLDYIDDTLKSPEELERYLRLPSLALVPDVQSSVEKTLLSWAQEKTSHLLEGSSRFANSAERNTLERYSNDNGRPSRLSAWTGAIEAYRMLRGRILLSRAGQPPRTILITSAVAGEGKTVTAVNTAITFAQGGRRVLLVDADLRRSRCHEMLKLEPGPGLSEVLTGQSEFHDLVVDTEFLGLQFLGAGAEPPDPPELLASPNMREFLAKLGDEYDHIIIDSAPTMPVSDSLMLSTYVDGVTMVVGCATPKQVAKRACERLEAFGANLFGVILNRVSIRPADDRHYNGYGYSYYRQSRFNGHGVNGSNGSGDLPKAVFR